MPVRRGIGIGALVGGRFRLEQELGEGGMGRVYEAVDLRYERPAAVKVIGRRLASEPEFRARFQREAAAAERANHPHVLPVWDYGEEGDSLYLATPLCDTDLGELVYERHGALDVEDALQILTQVAWALDWAHGRGVVHRDVKPENILLVHGPGEDHAYLADFGMARAVTDATLTQLGQPAALSPAYAAPEQWLGLSVGPEADQYSLAAALFACLTGRPPFYPLRADALRHAHLEAPPPGLPPEFGAGLEELSEVIQRALAKEPVARFPSCGAFLSSARAAVTDERRTAPASELEPTEPEHPAAPGSATTIGDTREAPSSPLLPPTVADAPVRAGPDQPPPASEPDGAAKEWDSIRGASDDRQAANRATETGYPEEREVGERPPAGAAPVAAADADEGIERPSRLTRVRVRFRERPLLPVALLGGLAIVAVLAVVLASGGSTTAHLTSIGVGRRPSDLAASGGRIWVANMAGRTLSAITATGGDARARAVDAGEAYPTRLAAGYGGLWAVSTTGALTRIDPRTAQKSGAGRLPGEVFGIAAGLGGLWVVDGSAGEVTRYTVQHNKLRASPPVRVERGAGDISLGPSAAFVTNGDDGTLTRIDATTLRATRIHVAKGIADVLVADGSVWIADPARGLVFRGDQNTGRPNAHFAVRRTDRGLLAAGAGSAFFIDVATGVATRFDEQSGELLSRQRVSNRGASAAVVAQGALWVADPAADSVRRLALK
ncbi:MAG TPA: protein kinase [Thermoleophilaceae bacterium]|jgi:serine/threonine protein kinase|nr:protein kinase [Thermoleophilaceae bacterium]